MIHNYRECPKCHYKRVPDHWFYRFWYVCTCNASFGFGKPAWAYEQEKKFKPNPLMIHAQGWSE